MLARPVGLSRIYYDAKIVKNLYGHVLKNQKILQTINVCVLLLSKVSWQSEKISLLYILGDICGWIHRWCESFWYLITWFNTSTKWSHICLLSTHNQKFVRLFSQQIWLRAQFFGVFRKHLISIISQFKLILNIV